MYVKCIGTCKVYEKCIKTVLQLYQNSIVSVPKLHHTCIIVVRILNNLYANHVYSMHQFNQYCFDYVLILFRTRARNKQI